LKERFVHGEYDRTIAPRLLMTAIHAAAVAATGWLLLGGGLEVIRARWETGWTLASPDRRWMLFAAALIYFLRVLVTSFITLKRKMGWGEAVLIAAWVLVIDVLFAVLGGVNPRVTGLVTALGVVLYVAGSYLNTGSELQRKWWKQRPENAGHLFTGGLFSYAVHINYFGDELLFTGYALVTGRAWSMLVPLVMLAGFLFFSIPELDRHLRAHYGAEFDSYARRTGSFVPFIY
jgi:protein-S-isoprenylcysteine O-methyltransferase Ste14